MDPKSKNITVMLRKNLARSSFDQVFVDDIEYGFCNVMYTCLNLKLNLNLKQKCPKIKKKNDSGEKAAQCQGQVNNKSSQRHKSTLRHRNSCHHKSANFDNAQTPLLNNKMDNKSADDQNTVMLEVGLPGDTWRYCVERQRLAEKSEWFRALLLGPLAPTQQDQPIKLQHVDKRAFDHMLRYLHDEPITFQSISTARATLDVAHQYLCPGLARLAVNYLTDNLKPSTVLQVFQGLSLYASDLSIGRESTAPSAPPAPGDDAGEIACICAQLLRTCLLTIDENPETVFREELFEELNGQEVANLASRDSLRLKHESELFSALERWATSECKRHGVDPNPPNKRKLLGDDVLFSVRFLLMSDKEFMNGPMASNMLSSEEAAFIMGRILGHNESQSSDMNRRIGSDLLSRLNSRPRGTASYLQRSFSDSAEREREDNKKNRRKECANQGQKVCSQIGNCFVRVLACVFD